MNTAARMESNGLPGKIHVSEATKHELVSKGRGDWIKPRTDKVVAKGKGEMQTYWVDVTGFKRSISGQSTATSLKSGQSGSDDGDLLAPETFSPASSKSNIVKETSPSNGSEFEV